MKNKSGRIVSKTKHTTAKREKRLVKHGYGTKKGHFGAVKIGKSRKMKGGMPYGNSFSPSAFDGSGIDGQGITNYGASSVDVQLAAGMAGGRRRKHSRKMRGGMPYGNAFVPAMVGANESTNGTLPPGSGIAGAGITDFGHSSIGVQMQAGMAGGKRRKRRGSRKMRGGTTKASNPMSFTPVSSPLGQALTH
jgi:hypothetical protein